MTTVTARWGSDEHDIIIVVQHERWTWADFITMFNETYLPMASEIKVPYTVIFDSRTRQLPFDSLSRIRSLAQQAIQQNPNWTYAIAINSSAILRATFATVSRIDRRFQNMFHYADTLEAAVALHYKLRGEVQGQRV